jgi:hypothetical protein
MAARDASTMNELMGQYSSQGLKSLGVGGRVLLPGIKMLLGNATAEAVRELDAT